MGADAFDPARNLAGDNERLESWKDIAAFLKRDVRTVQRWEKLDGLPIYRHGPGRLGGVYAYKPELDGWWDSVRARIENTPASAVVAGDAPTSSPDAPRARDAHWRSRPIVWVAFALATLLVGASLTVIVFRWQADRASGNPGARLGFQARDWVLIARFDNRTGDPALDGVLEYALERELANSRFVNVVPRERIEDTLRLMTKPPETVIDATVGREICLRDGDIRALITGRAERIGSRYLLSATVVDAAHLTTVMSVSEEVGDLDQILSGVRSLANGLRIRLGEALQGIQADDPKLEKTSTPSLQALRLYSKALDLEIRFLYPAAIDLLQQAIAEDATFSAAEIHLALTFWQLGRPSEQYLPHAQRALALSANTPEPERHFIRASALAMAGEISEAEVAFTGLLSLYPDHYGALNTLALLYGRLGREEYATPYLVRLADLRPNDLRAHLRAAGALSTVGDLSQASEVARRALRHVTTASAEGVEAPRLALIIAYERWLSGEVAGAFQDVSAIAATLAGRSKLDQINVALAAGNFYLAMGRLEDAEAMSTYARQSFFLASLALARGNRQALQRQLIDSNIAASPDRGSGVAFLAARSGLFVEADRTIKSLSFSMPAGSLESANGELALRRGDRGRGIALLETALRDLRTSGSPSFFLVAESLAESYSRDGRDSESLRVLEIAAKERWRNFRGSNAAAMFWMRTQAQLATLYRRVGRLEDARVVEAEILKLLTHADPDYPLLVELKTRPR